MENKKIYVAETDIAYDRSMTIAINKGDEFEVHRLIIHNNDNVSICLKKLDDDKKNHVIPIAAFNSFFSLKDYFERGDLYKVMYP